MARAASTAVVALQKKKVRRRTTALIIQLNLRPVSLIWMQEIYEKEECNCLYISESVLNSAS
jgi:hypothetical protein